MGCKSTSTLCRIIASIVLACYTCLWISCAALKPTGGDGCTQNTYVSPKTGTADHTLLPPGNQVQFSPAYSGTCGTPPMVITGTWITTDPANTLINPDTGLATCLNVTPVPAQIGFEKTTYGWSYDRATLTCK